MRAADLVALFDYNAWANERIFDAAAGVTPEEFAAPTRFPRGSLRGSLLHVLAAQRAWRAWWADQPPPPRLAEDDYPDVATLVARWREDEAELRAYLASRTDDELHQPRTRAYPTFGVTVTAPLWQFIVHIVTHSIQHRSDIAQMLTEVGRSPGDLDLIISLPQAPIG